MTFAAKPPAALTRSTRGAATGVAVTGADGSTRPGAGVGAWPFAALGTVLLLWGFGPPFSKMITAPPLTTSFARLWTSALGMILFQAAMGSRPSWRVLRASVVGGVAFGANSLFFFAALHHASIATLTVIGSLQPGLVMFGAARLFGERVSRRAVTWALVALGGAATAVLGSGAKVHSDSIGIACSVGSLVCMSVYFLAAKRARAHLGASEYVMGVMIWAALVVTPVVALGGGLRHLDQLGKADLVWLAIMFVGPGVGGQILMGWAVRYVPVGLSSLILLGSTAVSILAAWPIHGEVPTAVQLVGAGITLGAVGAILQSSRT